MAEKNTAEKKKIFFFNFLGGQNAFLCEYLMRGIIFGQMVSFGNASHGTLTNAGEELPEGNLNREQRHITSELPAISNNLDTLAIPRAVTGAQ